MLMGPAFVGGKKKEDAEGEGDGGEVRRTGDQGMDVFTLYPLFF